MNKHSSSHSLNLLDWESVLPIICRQSHTCFLRAGRFPMWRLDEGGASVIFWDFPNSEVEERGRSTLYAWAAISIFRTVQIVVGKNFGNRFFKNSQRQTLNTCRIQVFVAENVLGHGRDYSKVTTYGYSKGMLQCWQIYANSSNISELYKRVASTNDRSHTKASNAAQS